MLRTKKFSPAGPEKIGRRTRIAAALVLVLAVGACARIGPPAPVVLGPGSAPRLSPPVSNSVLVGRGVTVHSIARQHGVSVREIVTLNGLKPPYHLYTGQRLLLPRSSTHLVRRGDTLWDISRAVGVPMSEIARANRLEVPYTIYEGQRLVVPKGRGSRVASAERAPARAPSAAAPTPLRPRPANEAAGHGDEAPPASARVPPPARGGKVFLWPVEGRVVSRFGRKKGGLANDGINIAAERGTPVRAAEAGVVAYAGNELRGFGNLVLIRHAGSWTTAYGHNGELLVKRGLQVRKGDVIARVGSSGNVSNPQLHFEIRRGTKALDPLRHLSRQRSRVARTP